MTIPQGRLKKLAQYCLENPYDPEAFERLCVAIRPIAYSVMKLHRNVIPYYDKEDYLQEAYITLYRVLKRIESKPDILNSFQAYLWQSIKNTYCGCFGITFCTILLKFGHMKAEKMASHIHRWFIFRSMQSRIIQKNARAVSDIIGKIERQYLKSNEKVDYSQLLEENA